MKPTSQHRCRKDEDGESSVQPPARLYQPRRKKAEIRRRRHQRQRQQQQRCQIGLEHHSGAVDGTLHSECHEDRGFKDKFQLPFPLLSDPDAGVIEAYGSWGEKQAYPELFVWAPALIAVSDTLG